MTERQKETMARRAKMYEMYQDGFSYGQIAKAFGMDKVSVYRGLETYIDQITDYSKL